MGNYDYEVCIFCKENYVEDEEWMESLHERVDRFGMESLTENEQAILEGVKICEMCM